ncbi:MAG: pyridoxal phosphate-dependent aminotransferase [Anaerolineae bacterium]
MARLADRMGRLGPETVFDVVARARELEDQGRDVVHLEIGEPDFPTPPHIVEAAVAALHRAETRYVAPVGILPLREAIADCVGASRGIAVSPDQVVVTPGAKPIITFALLALAQEGDEVLYPDPGFPIYESMIRFVGAKPVPLPLYESQGFCFDVAELRRLVTRRTRLLILNSPHNPTGGLLCRKDLEAIAEIAQQYDLMVLSDEIYGRLVYGGEHLSPASLPGMQERTIIMDGFSKTYAMTGWRLGYGVMNRVLAEAMRRLVINSNSCVPGFVQWAGIEALRGPQDCVAEMLRAFAERRRALLEGVRRIPGLTSLDPQGAFYVFPNITATGLSSREFADRLLEEEGVSTLAGTAFGPQGEGCVRISYANSLDNIRRALERIERFVSRLARG